MKKKVFISFAEKDRSIMLRLKKAILKSDFLIPIIVEDKKEGALHLAKLVSNGILESHYFIPILTKNSINTQWINQEIGFAQANGNKIEIVPLIESEIIDQLKGFINNQIQLRYNFKTNENKKKERLSFRKCYSDLIIDLDSKVKDLNEANTKDQTQKLHASNTILAWGINNRNSKHHY